MGEFHGVVFPITSHSSFGWEILRMDHGKSRWIMGMTRQIKGRTRHAYHAAYTLSNDSNQHTKTTVLSNPLAPRSHDTFIRKGVVTCPEFNAKSNNGTL